MYAGQVIEISHIEGRRWGLPPDSARVAAIDEALRARCPLPWITLANWFLPAPVSLCPKEQASCAARSRSGLALAVLPLLKARR